MKIVAGLVVAATVAVAHAATGPVPVTRSKADDATPVALGRYLAWTRRLSADGGLAKLDVFLRGPNGGVRRINAEGTFASAVGFVGDRLAYEVGREVRLLDLTTWRTVSTAAPSGAIANPTTRAGALGLIYVKRGRCGTQKLVLYESATGSERPLDTIDCEAGALVPGGVSSGFATWSKCLGASPCAAHRYEASSRQTEVAPNPQHRSQKTTAVLPDGSVLIAEQRISACGPPITLVRWSRDGSRRVLANLTYGGASVPSLAAGFANHSLLVYFERRACGGTSSDIYVLRVDAA